MHRDESYTISASIVLFKPDMNQLKGVIESFAPAEKRLLYLIDNSPVETDVKAISSSNKYITYYYTGENKGYGAGHNIGINMSIKDGAKYHCVLNPDLAFNPVIINIISEFMDADESIGQVMPKILNEKGELQYLCKLIPTPFDLLFKRFLPSFFSQKYLTAFS
ncbi:hypothetical protein K7I13_00585 [Brucepastera parasyntrophica]|uniref:hypothetical protein n=1 Tax=Brucepastera parasyntrophica TaxID=2880008 RepID=UPI00210BEC50|nr:hypothetical protein [Brucepastera parasyntrophica]ULQ59884.1 hypothetical protein K7I13_00585 [Brucepastera parasyntrophica]